MNNMESFTLTCPECKTQFKVDESKLESIIDQVKGQIASKIRAEEKEQREEAIAIAVESEREKNRVHFVKQEEAAAKKETEYTRQLAEKTQELERTKHHYEIAIQQAKADGNKEREELRLRTVELEREIDRLRSEGDQMLHEAEAKARMTIVQLTEKLSNAEKNMQAQISAAVARNEAQAQKNLAEVKGKAEKELIETQKKATQQIAALQGELQRAEDVKKLAVSEVQREKDATISTQNTEIARLHGELANKDQEKALALKAAEDRHQQAETFLKDQLASVKDFKRQLSTKMLGESLEDHIQVSFEQARLLGFQNAKFEKDTLPSEETRTKGDFIFRDYTENGDEYISIMIEAKTESEETELRNRKTNKDYLPKLDKDRRMKSCEFALLVSTLERDSELYNMGIVQSADYEKMYIIRPQFFIPLLTVLCNAAKGALSIKEELEKLKRMNIDVFNFEDNVSKIRELYEKNYSNSIAQRDEAVKQIDNAIAVLEKAKEALRKSDSSGAKAKQNLEQLTIKKLTANAPLVKQMFEDIAVAQTEGNPEATTDILPAAE